MLPFTLVGLANCSLHSPKLQRDLRQLAVPLQSGVRGLVLGVARVEVAEQDKVPLRWKSGKHFADARHCSPVHRSRICAHERDSMLSPAARREIDHNALELVAHARLQLLLHHDELRVEVVAAAHNVCLDSTSVELAAVDHRILPDLRVLDPHRVKPFVRKEG